MATPRNGTMANPSVGQYRSPLQSERAVRVRLPPSWVSVASISRRLNSLNRTEKASSPGPALLPFRCHRAVRKRPFLSLCGHLRCVRNWRELAETIEKTVVGGAGLEPATPAL